VQTLEAEELNLEDGSSSRQATDDGGDNDDDGVSENPAIANRVDPAQTLAQSAKTVQQIIFSCVSNLLGAWRIF